METIWKKTFFKDINDMNMYDPPLMGIFEYNKKYTAYSLKVLVGLDVEEPAKMSKSRKFSHSK